MKYYKYTDKEIQGLLDSIIILTDTREQENKHILKYFDSKNINHQPLKLDHGDYTFMIPINKDLGIYRSMYFNNIISIERKANLEELSGNFTKDRARIESEFLRSKGKIILLIENASYQDIIMGNYNTRYKPKSFIGTLKAFECRYNLQTNFIDPLYSGNFIYYTFYYAARELLKNGNIRQAI